jgi:uncharacterized protein DUF1566
MPRRVSAFLTIAGLALIGMAGRPVRAADIIVSSTSGATGGPGCTLRDAITAANTDAASGGCPAGSGADTIILTAGATYTLTLVDNTGVPTPPVTVNPTPTATAALQPRFVDNGDGTVTDRQTGLMWEQKTGTFDPFKAGTDCATSTCSDPHDVNNYYAWSASGTAPDGSAFTDFLPRVNGTLCSASPCTGLGGYSDWRLPTVWELYEILNRDQASACGSGGVVCIDPAFGPTAWNLYWSATTANDPAYAWGVGFLSGGAVGGDIKTGYGGHSSNFARAVRGPMRPPEIRVTSASAAGIECTLCDAITAVKTDSVVDYCAPGGGAGTIILAGGARYMLTDLDNAWAACTAVPQSNGLPSITSDITITGNGATIARSDAPDTPAFRLFHVAPAGRLTIYDLTLTNGKMPDIDLSRPGPGGDGGGILNEGVLTLINVALTSNQAGDTMARDGAANPLAGCAGRGGGVLNAGTLTLTGGSVSLNHAGSSPGADSGGGCPGDGGGIYNDSGATLTVSETAITGNAAGFTVDYGGGSGGGIFNAGNLVITSSTLAENRAGNSDDGIYGGNGGGLANVATVEVADSTVANNTAGSGDSIGGDGGGIFNTGTATFRRCSISSNAAGSGTDGGSGGGLANRDAGTLSLINSTVSGNHAGDGDESGDGAGIFNAGTLTLASCTIADNTGGQGGTGTSDGKGGGIAASGPLTALRNTLVAENTIIDDNGVTIAGNCDGLLTSQGYNFIEDVGNCTVIGDVITGLDPHLGPLQDNGGPTETQALLAGSPAIDAGNPDGCTDFDGNLLTTDQRGAPRAVSGDTRCDIGAYETTLPALATITPTATWTPTLVPPTPSATPTRTPTSTRLPSSTPSPTSTPRSPLELRVGSASGAPGTTVTFAVVLVTRGNDVAGIQNDITFDRSTPIGVRADGTPDCTVNPSIDKIGRFAFLQCSMSPPGSCTRVRALVVAVDSVAPIPDGSLVYSCRVNIAPSATPATYPLVSSAVVAADPNGGELPEVGANGAIVVATSDPPGMAGSGASQAGSGCSTVPGPRRDRLSVVLLLPAVLLCRRRFRGGV